MEEKREASAPSRPQPKTYHFYSWFFPGLFTTRRDEKLFLEYTQSQKQRAIPRFIITGLFLQFYSALVPGELNFAIAYALTASAIIVNVSLLLLHYCLPSKRIIISHVTWFAIWAQLLVSAGRRVGDAYNELLGWAALLQHLTLATLPFNAPTLIVYSLLSMSAYIFTQYLNACDVEYVQPDDLFDQVRHNTKRLVKKMSCRYLPNTLFFTGNLQFQHFALR